MLSVAQAARILGVGPSRVRALIHRKRNPLPATKVSGVWVIDEKDLEMVKVRKPGRPRKS
jgi:excisionase family DNA binding protein